MNDPSSFRLKVATSEVAKSYEIVYLRDGKEHTAKIVPAASDKVVFDVERESPKPEARQPTTRRRSPTSAWKSSL